MGKVQLNWRHIPYSRIFYLSINGLQLTAAITLVSLCGSDISENDDNKGRSITAIIIGTLSIITALSLATEIFLTMPSRVWLIIVFLWQWFIVCLWCAASGLLGGVYLPSGRTRMRVATGFAYLNLVLWLLCSVAGTINCCASARKRKAKERSGDGVENGKAIPLTSSA